ncbi:hypothetical protein OIU77_018076 [Salix suchowensis]|uniref:Mediator complex subunit 15 KIX domain-containing protein n=1 Tax=Salix suchowensis TaxID=1278906 RepID=A0ABQ8ZQZ1_9ROSI|nr:hypothetical protein OIU77_018076 [Salix suchowensis]
MTPGQTSGGGHDQMLKHLVMIDMAVGNLRDHYQMQASSDREFVNRLTNIAVQFEEKTFRNSATQGSYAYTIGKKMGSFAGATVKSEASQTTGKNPSGPGQNSIVNDAGRSSETSAFRTIFPVFGW